MNTRRSVGVAVRNKDSGKYASICGCCHNDKERTQLTDVKKGKKLRKSLYAFFVDSGLLSRNSKYICKTCIANYKSAVGLPRDNPDRSPLVSQDGDCAGSSTTAETLMEELEAGIRNDCRRLYKEKPCATIDTLVNFKSIDWLRERPKKLVSFISNICDLNPENETAAFQICKVIEQLYSCVNQRLVLPNAFRHNLLTYSLSNSELLVNFNGKSMPSGGYTYLKSWLSNQAEQEIRVPDGVVKIVFDNEQVVGNSEAYNPYGHFDISIKTNDLKVYVGEPDMVNPNGFENISQILCNVGYRAGIKQYDASAAREWLILENDGGILYIIYKLIYNVLRCPKCNDVMYGRETFEEHICFVLHQVTPIYEYDWILPQLALLHLEINSGRAFLSCNWLVFMEEVYKVLGFVSENALKYGKKGTDHHKMWQILEVTYLAMADELLLPYVRDCLRKNTKPSVEGYLTSYNDAVESPSYEYAQQMAFTFLHAMMMLRRGIRNGQHLPILAAKGKLALLFFGRNHPICQYMLIQDFRIECMLPDTVGEFTHLCRPVEMVQLDIIKVVMHMLKK